MGWSEEELIPRQSALTRANPRMSCFSKEPTLGRAEPRTRWSQDERTWWQPDLVMSWSEIKLTGGQADHRTNRPIGEQANPWIWADPRMSWLEDDPIKRRANPMTIGLRQPNSERVNFDEGWVFVKMSDIPRHGTGSLVEGRTSPRKVRARSRMKQSILGTASPRLRHFKKSQISPRMRQSEKNAS
jgi:hypothetical protein